MDVTFTKVAGRRYLMTIVRERGPELAPRQGPGYDGYLPHDAVHCLAESEAGISGGVFGRIAAGRIAAGHSNIFTTADPTLRRRQARREAKRRPRETEGADMARSESLASFCQPLWELRAGHRSELPLWFSSVEPSLLASPLVERIVGRLDDFAGHWHALPMNSSVTLSWRLSRHGGAPVGGRRSSVAKHAPSLTSQIHAPHPATKPR